MNRPYILFIPSIVAALFLAFLLSRSHLRHISRKMGVDFDRLLDRQTHAVRIPCEKLLEGIEGSKAIADNALRGPARSQDLQRALSEISALLSRTLMS